MKDKQDIDLGVPLPTVGSSYPLQVLASEGSGLSASIPHAVIVQSKMNDGRLWFTDAMGNDAVMSAEEREAIERTGRGSWERYRFEEPEPVEHWPFRPWAMRRPGQTEPGASPPWRTPLGQNVTTHLHISAGRRKYHIADNGQCHSSMMISKNQNELAALDISTFASLMESMRSDMACEHCAATYRNYRRTA